MSKPQLQRQKRTSPKRVLAAVVALTVAFLFLASVIGLAEKYIAIRKRMRSLKEEEYQLTEKYATLKETNEYMATEEGMERELRTKYNVIKPGEGMIVITDPALPEDEATGSSRVGRWWDSLLRGLGFRRQ